MYSLDVLLFLFGTSLLFHVQFKLCLPNLHTGFSRGRSGGLIFPSPSEFSTVYCDPHSWRLWHNQQRRNRCFFWNSLAFSMIQQILAIWSLVSLPFLKPAWKSGSSWFTCCWSLAWRILNITLLNVLVVIPTFFCLILSMWDECNCAVVTAFFAIAFLRDWNENWPFLVLWPLLNFPNLLAYWVQHFHSIIIQNLK